MLEFPQRRWHSWLMDHERKQLRRNRVKVGMVALALMIVGSTDRYLVRLFDFGDRHGHFAEHRGHAEDRIEAAADRAAAMAERAALLAEQAAELAERAAEESERGREMPSGLSF